MISCRGKGVLLFTVCIREIILARMMISDIYVWGADEV